MSISFRYLRSHSDGNYEFRPRSTQWLYDSSDVIYPSVYMTEKIKPRDRAPMVRGRVRESVRLARSSRGRDRKVIVYYRYLFTDTKRFLSQVK